MLHSRLRPAPRRNPTTAPATPATPTSDLRDQDEGSEVEESEDFFGSFLAHLFPDDAPQFHGDPGQRLIYSSPRYGELEIMVPPYPDQTEKRSEDTSRELRKGDGINRVEEGRKLFAHMLWSAGMVIAEGVENADRKPTEIDSATQTEARGIWAVQGERVMELGAGAALASLVCALANAAIVVATDHPSSPSLAGAIDFNLTYNFRRRHDSPNTTIVIQPHEWGCLSDSFSLSHKGAFTRIIAADCYWMPSQHENLARTMQWFLAPGGKVWVVAGFHTGRAIVAGFFETAEENGFAIETIFERDLMTRDEHGGEVRREWAPVRDHEGPENRGRWCVVAVLKRKE
ncbi:uncharacterized protein N7482_000618 [Penicillium canariense]|uniref:Nicotinamide N-methyltransferase n=1 Tax=Penicillium canariense TaxID=189055 RepID=A0A9W9LSB2_9EURO|nr:uncharacterized protein N7482_000618 [Penicillium canariense]KAJ5174741.1 hypothetical protein N7482_000618 [Penicillium canariense]